METIMSGSCCGGSAKTEQAKVEMAAPHSSETASETQKNNQTKEFSDKSAKSEKCGCNCNC